MIEIRRYENKDEKEAIAIWNAVVATNIHALHLYERLGFTQLGVIPQGFRMKDGHYEDIIPHYIKFLHIALIYLAVINVVTFFMYGVDKWKAKRSKWRIPEATLLGLAVLGGSVGAWLGMKVWHHKTLHKKFRYGVPAIIIVQIALICYFLYR